MSETKETNNTPTESKDASPSVTINNMVNDANTIEPQTSPPTMNVNSPVQYENKITTQPQSNLSLTKMSLPALDVTHSWGSPLGQWQKLHQSSAIPGCPPGLEILASLDHVWVIEQIEMLQLISKWETNNRYLVQNGNNENIFFVLEDSDFCLRQCCNQLHKLSLTFYEKNKHEVLKAHRKCRCDCCLCFYCLQVMDVITPDMVKIGSVKQNWDPIFPNLSVRDGYDNTVLKIKGSFITSACCGKDKRFHVSIGEVKIGEIVKKWGGIIRETSINADIFGVSFHAHLDCITKANLIAAVFLVDYVYYNTGQNCRKDSY